MLTFRYAALLVLIPVAAVFANSEWVASVVFQACQPQDWHEVYRGEVELAKELENSDQEVWRRIEIKESLVHQLIEGRLSLAEVTRQFLVMNQDRPGYMEVIRATYAGSNDEEKTARNVISYVTVELSRASSEQQAEVLERLEYEFECLFQTHRNFVR
ncbi:MAG: hypothetical protein U0792_04950 [Gemmataceae bacterium]